MIATDDACCTRVYFVITLFKSGGNQNKMRLWTVVAGSCCFAVVAASLVAQTANLSPADKQFLDLAAQTDMTEANLGKVAQDKSDRQDVKDYGKMLTDDHTANYNQLAQLATKVGATIPKGIDKPHDAKIAGLSKLKGPAFDRQFAAAMAAGHRQVIAAFTRQAQHGDNPDIKAYANDTLPHLQKHLEGAEALTKAKGK